ncbi:hypothetical protein [Rhizobium mesosinicum]|uniref:Uncharacterized protein n=1 Tax=Rhizobium mesosinicum TaxID=335017 RepID=A0ABS7H3S9_9HYPH|nr:hypothetical protein [Rhizobium mesosinicum]MBW9056566.1 hypothetical protein [Rhizobium mesosinicum]
MAIRSFPLEIQLLAQDWKSSLSCRFNRQLPVFLSVFLYVFFVIFVLSAAMEVVMFTNRSNYLPDKKQRQLAIFRR